PLGLARVTLSTHGLRRGLYSCAPSGLARVTTFYARLAPWLWSCAASGFCGPAAPLVAVVQCLRHRLETPSREAAGTPALRTATSPAFLPISLGCIIGAA